MSSVLPSSPARPDEAPAAAGWSWRLLGVVAVYYALVALLPRVGLYLGLGTNDGWFIDVHALLAAGEAHLQGLPIYFWNPLDIYHRPHSYSNWWLILGDWGLKRSDTLWLGLALVAAFLVTAVRWLRPATRRQCGWSLAVLCAPAVQLCLVRGNNDLVVFLVLAALVPALTSALPVARVGAVCLIGFATGLKYYPVVVALLLLAESNRRLQLWRWPALFAVLLLVLFSVYEDTLYFSRSLPAPEGLFSFGARNGLLWAGLTTAGARHAVVAGLLLLLAALAARSAAAVRTEPEAGELGFVLGAVLLAGCFWAGSNWSYRWIFAVWLLPALWRDAPLQVLRPGEHRALRLLLPICLWWDGLCSLAWNFGPGRALGLALDRYGQVLWLLIQPVHWLVFAVLTLACLRFAAGHFRRVWLRVV